MWQTKQKKVNGRYHDNILERGQGCSLIHTNRARDASIRSVGRPPIGQSCVNTMVRNAEMIYSTNAPWSRLDAMISDIPPSASRGNPSYRRLKGAPFDLQGSLCHCCPPCSSGKSAQGTESRRGNENVNNSGALTRLMCCVVSITMTKITLFASYDGENRGSGEGDVRYSALMHTLIGCPEDPS